MSLCIFEKRTLDSMWQLMGLSPFQSLLLITVTLFALLRWKKIWKYIAEQLRIRRFVRPLPSSWTLPIFGNALELWETHRTVEILTKKSCDLNAPTYCFWLGLSPKIVVTDPKDIEIILFSSKASQKEQFYEMVEPMLDPRLFDSQHPLYKDHKKLLTSLISGSSPMQKYMRDFNIHASVFIKLLERRIDKGEFDVLEDVKLCVGDIVYDLIGFEATAQKGHPSSFLTEVTSAIHIFYRRAMSPWLYPNVIFNLTNMGKSWFKFVEKSHSFIDENVLRKKAAYMTDPDVVRSNGSIIDYFIGRMIKSEDWTVSDIRSEVIAVFAGAYETLNCIICWVLLMLAMYPEVQKKVREEILNKVNNNEVSQSEAANLKYLDMVIKETIRLFPVGPLLPRKITEDLKLTTCTLPRGSSAFMLPFATHRGRRYWEKPEKFIPERFLPENSKNRHPYAFIPFSGGIVSCPGQKYGIMCIKVIVAHILRAYQLETSVTLDTLQIQIHVSTSSANGYPISIRKFET